jgi:hypothetical protein
MTAIYLYGRDRAAALHVLRKTTLGPALAMFGETSDVGSHVELVLSNWQALSDGERALWDFLTSLAGRGTVNLAMLFAAIDDACTKAVIEAVGIAAGTREVAS